MTNSLAHGQRIKRLTVVDDFSRESVQIGADSCIKLGYVTRLRDQAAQFRGNTNAIGSENGSEFTARAFIASAQRNQIEHILIEPASPTQNAYIASFNGRFRDECINEQWLMSLARVRIEIARWRRVVQSAGAAGQG